MIDTTLLARRQDLTKCISEHPYDPLNYISRARIHNGLGYPDLAAGDANKALLLTDEALDIGGEYHEHVSEALSIYISDVNAEKDLNNSEPSKVAKAATETIEDGVSALAPVAKSFALEAYTLLSQSLTTLGCLHTAVEFCDRGLKIFPGNPGLHQARAQAFDAHRATVSLPHDQVVELDDLPKAGLARREIYSWSSYEPERMSPESLSFLNKEMAKVAPKCEVRAVQLPSLGPDKSGKNYQLGMFAKEDIASGETLLREVSLLTATNRPLDPFCDACSAPLPSLSDPSASTTVTQCSECDDVFFCSPTCLETAQRTYHPAVCGLDISVLASAPLPEKYSANTLYLLLLRRLLATSVAQSITPLNLPSISYIWGDFNPPFSAPSLPFTYQHNIAVPLLLLEKMEVNIFSPPEGLADIAETWVHNTAYAKFRGTASAFLSPISQKPETAAVHSMWCLANHDCNPNVAWDWSGGEIRFWARTKDERVDGAEGGIKKGEEIQSHYCDVRMGVRERREWAIGSLGGICECTKCLREEAEIGLSRSRPLLDGNPIILEPKR